MNSLVTYFGYDYTYYKQYNSTYISIGIYEEGNLLRSEMNTIWSYDKFW